MKNQSVFDQFAKGLGDAVADIREKVVEEGWFGRVVNDRNGPEAQPIEGWPQARDVQPEAGDHDREKANDMDMDR